MKEYVDLTSQPRSGSFWDSSLDMDEWRDLFCLANRRNGIVFDCMVKLTILRHLTDVDLRTAELVNIVTHELHKWMKNRGLLFYCFYRSDDSHQDWRVVRFLISVPPPSRVAFARVVQRIEGHFPHWASEVRLMSDCPDEISPMRQWLRFPELWPGHLPASLARGFDEAGLEQLATAPRVPRRPAIGAAKFSGIPPTLTGFALELAEFPPPPVDPAQPFLSFYSIQPFSDWQAERRRQELAAAAQAVTGPPPSVRLKLPRGVQPWFDASFLVEQGEVP